MELGLFLVFSFLFATAFARPHGSHVHHKRAVVTEYVVVTATAETVVVYVDQFGNVLNMSNDVDAPQASPPEPAAQPVIPDAPYHAVPTNAPAAPPPEVGSPPVVSPPVEGSPSEPTEPNAAPPSGLGITYSVYTTGPCKTSEQIMEDFAKIDGYGFVRIYGTDCDQVSKLLPVVRAKGMKLFVGVFDINKVTEEINVIIDAASESWDLIHTVSVGNELINSGRATVGAVVSAIDTARGLLSAAGYTGPVVTVDTFVAMIANPELCNASDYAAANCHAFFDGGIDAQGAGSFVRDQANRVSEACGGKKTIITESGWPSAGLTHVKAVPSLENQQIAIASLKENFPSDMVLFSAFNEDWKVDFPGSFECEKHWGIL